MPAQKTLKTKKIQSKKAVIKTLIDVKKPKISSHGISVPQVSALGKQTGTRILAENLFGIKDNQSLVAQTHRVHTINSRQGTQSTKTRGTVSGSTRKIYRQKGTGRARHGSIKAPIFVGGGIVFGPHPRALSASMPKKMRRKALLTTLSQKALHNQITIMKGLNDVSGKTKDMYKLFKSLSFLEKPLLIIVLPQMQACIRASRNISGVSVQTVGTLSVTDVLQNYRIVFAEEALQQFEKLHIKTAV